MIQREFSMSPLSTFLVSPSSLCQDLSRRLDDKTARVGVIGLGYVGLPLLRALANVGFHTTGFDIDEHKITLLKSGASYIRHLDDGEVKQLLSDTDARRKQLSDFEEIESLLGPDDAITRAARIAYGMLAQR